MWVLEAFQKEGDDLVYEEPLQAIDTPRLRELFGIPADNPMHDSYPVTEDQVGELQGHVERPILLDTYDYFVDQYQDE
jgi:hypothetical protein